jgi:hypothetical protein
MQMQCTSQDVLSTSDAAQSSAANDNHVHCCHMRLLLLLLLLLQQHCLYPSSSHLWMLPRPLLPMTPVEQRSGSLLPRMAVADAAAAAAAATLLVSNVSTSECCQGHTLHDAAILLTATVVALTSG